MRWVIAVAFVVVLFSYKIYFLRAHSEGAIIWNDSEAYIFTRALREGLPVSVIGYPWFLLKEYLGAVGIPEDSRAFLVAIRVTSAGVERHFLQQADRVAESPGSNPIKLTPLEGGLMQSAQGSSSADG